MEETIAQGLGNKIYEKRKTAAYDLERVLKAETDEQKTRAIILQLCGEFIGTSTRPARSASGGLIGLAAATIALGKHSAKYLDLIMPAVLSCFASQDSRIRYYSTESLYNIAKVAKGETLLYFNEIFDMLCKLSADSEISVKNGAELLDRLLKDIVSEKATSYISLLHRPESEVADTDVLNTTDIDSVQNETWYDTEKTTAFSLVRFIPLLSERLYVINPYTRIFLVSWITVLNSIPDLDLIAFLPDFLDGLMKFLSDTHQDVRIATSRLLDSFLDEIKRVTLSVRAKKHGGGIPEDKEKRSVDVVAGDTTEALPYEEGQHEDDVPPAFDQFVDFSKIISILQTHLNSADEAIQLTALRWVSEFFAICPSSLLPFTPKLLRVVLPAISHESTALRRAARDVNDKLLQLIRVVIDGDSLDDKENVFSGGLEELDFVNSATIQLLDDHEETRVSALGWLMELVRLTSKKSKDDLGLRAEILPALLKTLSDTSEAVVKKDLELLAQISKNDDYFTQLMVNLLTLFSSDRKLLEQRGSLIIRQLSINLNVERIYRTLAENLEKETDLEFAQLIVQHLNNNLLTAPELFEARKRLRQLNTVDGSAFFTALYRSWSHNAVATFSLCLLAQAYEHASNLLQVFAELEISVDILIQIDKLVQLLESPVFTYLRLQLLEPEKYPYLNKCLYGLLMLLPQTQAFHTLRNRLNSISPHGFVPNSRSSVSNLRVPKGSEIPWESLLTRFRQLQNRHGRTNSKKNWLE